MSLTGLELRGAMSIYYVSRNYRQIVELVVVDIIKHRQLLLGKKTTSIVERDSAM